MHTSTSPRARRFNYLSDVRFEREGLRVRQSESVIPLDRAFFRSAVSIAKLDAYFLFQKTGRALRGKPSNGSIAFYPEQPARWYNIYSVVQFAGLRIVSDLDEADHIFIFDDATYSDAGAALAPHHAAKAINLHASDISKHHVERIFAEVFGYDLAIDPRRHTGPAIRKSQTNGAHDGVTIECPIPDEAYAPDYSYQRLIDSTFSGETSEDLRFAYAFGEIVTVFHKHKPLDDRFGTTYLSVDVRQADDVFSEQERKLLIRFCQRMGLDFGAVDAMRDKHDGRLYVVDVNKTCMPVLSLPLTVQVETFRRIGDAFASGLSRRSAAEQSYQLNHEHAAVQPATAQR